MKHFISFLLLVNYITLLNAQNTEVNLEKYWYYRQKLKSDFIVVSPGNEPGTNIPASERYGSYDQDHNIYKENKISWGDGNANLQYYIAVLATEYRLLKDYGEDYTQTLNELVYALRAIERIDIAAERNSWTTEQKLNGFFVRDDVMNSFTSVHNDETHNFLGHNNEPLEVESGYNQVLPYPMSVDNVWHYLIGFALVNKLVDDNQVFQDALGESVTVREWTKKLTYRMVSSMHDPCIVSFDAIVPSIDCPWWMVLLGICFKKVEVCFKGWSVKDPVSHERVEQGSYPQLTNAGLAEAGNLITSGAYPNLHYPYSRAWRPFFAQAVAVSYYMHDQEINVMISPVPEIIGVIIPSGIQIILNEIFSWTITVADRDPYMESALISIIGNDLFDDYLPQYTTDTYEHLRNVSTETTDRLGWLAYEHFPLIYISLHGNTSGSDIEADKDIYIELLNEAPDCGPFNYGEYSINHDDFSQNWSSTSRLVWPENCHSETNWQGNYNGLDYMFLHNLYWLVYEEKSSQDLHVSINLPHQITPWILWGDDENPAIFFAENNLTADNTIASNGNVTYTAGNEIELLPGFETEEGADFTAYTTDDYVELVQYKKLTPDFDCSAKNVPILNPDKISELEDNQKIKIVLYPNPTSGKFKISVLKDFHNGIQMEIVNLSGSIIYTQKLNSKKTEINIENQPAGIYIIKIISNNKVYTSKIMKL